VRYLGIDVDDALEMAEDTEAWRNRGPHNWREIWRFGSASFGASGKRLIWYSWCCLRATDDRQLWSSQFEVWNCRGWGWAATQDFTPSDLLRPKAEVHQVSMKPTGKVESWLSISP